jgi:hypothetical protein
LHVDVEKRRGRKRSPQNTASANDAAVRAAWLKVVLAARRTQRHRDAGNAEERTLERTGHGAGIGDVVARDSIPC